MQTAAPRRFPFVLAATLAIGVHVGIVVSLPHARPHLSLTSQAAAAAAAADLVPHAQFQALAPAPRAEEPTQAAAPAAPKPVAAAAHAARVAHLNVAKRAEPATIDMRPHDDAQPVVIATPLPVTVVTPPAEEQR